MSGDFIEYKLARKPASEMLERAEDFYQSMNTRRSVRQFSDEPVPLEVVEAAIRTASTAPSGAHRQPWTFVVIGDADMKTRIRQAVEKEESENYEGGRLPTSWRDALEPLGTNSSKPYLDTVPWIVVLFEQRYSITGTGDTQKNYYVKESVGIAAGMFIAALHNAGVATLTHTPSPMAFLTRVLERPENERPFALFPIGYPDEDCTVPALERKALSDVMVRFPVVDSADQTL